MSIRSFWIRHITPDKAGPTLKKLYDRIAGPKGQVDNILMAHSLRPHSLNGHMSLYKNVIHHSGNTLPKWYLECLGVYVSHLNECQYCVDHHFAGLKRLLANESRAAEIRTAMIHDQFDSVLEPKFKSGMVYARKLTLSQAEMRESDIVSLRNSGLDDGEILEINQVISYFNYANRTVLGLGVNTSGDILGLSPGDSEADNWSHT